MRWQITQRPERLRKESKRSILPKNTAADRTELRRRRRVWTIQPLKLSQVCPALASPPSQTQTHRYSLLQRQISLQMNQWKQRMEKHFWSPPISSHKVVKASFLQPSLKLSAGICVGSVHFILLHLFRLFHQRPHYELLTILKRIFTSTFYI